MALLVWLMLAVLQFGALGSDPSDPGPPPPEPNPMKIEVPRGGAVLITLSANSLTSPITRFRIKRTAKLGKLGTPKMVTASTAVVRYQPPPGEGPDVDSFVIEVQSLAGVSAPADVDINITDKDPLFIAPTDIEFGQVLPGQTARRTLDLQNLGGGLAEGTVVVPDGWTVEGNPAYHLLAGGKQTFTVDFTPAGAGPCTGDVEYTGNHEKATDLNGEGLAPLAVTSGTVELIPSGTMRIGTIHVVNRTSAAQIVRVTPGARVQADATAEVPAGGVADIALRVAGDAEIEDHVTVEGDGLKEDVPVHAMAIPAPEPAMAETTPAAPPAEASQPPPTQPERPAEMAQVANSFGPAPASTPEDQPPPATLPPLLQDNQDTEAPEPIQIAALEIGNVGQTEAEAGCDFRGDSQAQSYRLEMQSVGLDPEGHPAILWTPLPATLTVKGPIVVAQLKDLKPATLYVLRILGLDDQGNMIEMTSSAGFWTLPPPRAWWWRWLEIGGPILAVAAGLWWWRQRKRRQRW